MKRGPEIRWMTQLVASYYYDRNKLGPAIAHRKLSALFDEDTYSIIRGSAQSLVYQLFLLDGIMQLHLKKLSDKKQYINNIRGHVKLCLFSIICKICREQGVSLGHDKMEQHLVTAYQQKSIKWEKVIKQLVDHINNHYKKTSVNLQRKELYSLTPANYFKNGSMMKSLLNEPISKSLRKTALEVLIPA